MKLTVPKIDIRQRKTQVVIGVSVGVLLVIAMLALVFTVMRESDKTAKEQPAIRVGETSLSRAQYSKMISQAKSQEVSEETAKVVIEEYIRYQAVAQKLKIEVPGYVVAAQAQTEQRFVYTPFDQLTEYEVASLYPKALFALISVIQAGGVVATVYHAPYEGESKAYAKEQAQQVRAYKTGNVTTADGKPPRDPLRIALQNFSTDEKTHFKEGINQSKVVLLTNNGDEIIASDTNYTTSDQLPVVKKPFSPSMVSLIQSLKDDQLSDVAELRSPDAFIVIHKDKTYGMNESIVAQLQAALQNLGESR